MFCNFSRYPPFSLCYFYPQDFSTKVGKDLVSLYSSLKSCCLGTNCTTSVRQSRYFLRILRQIFRCLLFCNLLCISFLCSCAEQSFFSLLRSNITIFLIFPSFDKLHQSSICAISIFLWPIILVPVIDPNNQIY